MQKQQEIEAQHQQAIALDIKRKKKIAEQKMIQQQKNTQGNHPRKKVELNYRYSISVCPVIISGLFWLDLA